MAAAGDRPEGYGLIVTTGAEERVVAHAVFELERADRAEVAFAVADEMQGRGLATVLIAHLAQVASARGVTTFTATVLPENRRMISVFRESGFPVARARVAGRDRARVPDRAGGGRAAQVRGSRPGRGRRGGRAGAAAALGRGDRRVAAAGLLRRRGVPARARQRLPRRALPGQPERGLHRLAPRGARRSRRRPGRSTSRSSPCRRRRCPAVARECAEAGVAALVVITAGFAEAGAEGAARLAELLEACRSTGMRLVGPNSMGVVNTDPAVSLTGTFGRADVPAGHGRVRVAERGVRGGGDRRHVAPRDRPERVRLARRQGGPVVATTSCSTGSRTRRPRSSRCTWSPSATRASSAASRGGWRGPSRCWRSRRGGRAPARGRPRRTPAR